jgi:hypothetical protein
VVTGNRYRFGEVSAACLGSAIEEAFAGSIHAEFVGAVDRADDDVATGGIVKEAGHSGRPSGSAADTRAAVGLSGNTGALWRQAYADHTASGSGGAIKDSKHKADI